MKNKGFTLIEVMIVIAIVAIMSAIAVPGFRTFMAQSRLKGAAREVMTDLMNARMMAVSQNQKVKIYFDNDNHTYKICSDADGNGTVDLNEGNYISKDLHRDYYDVNFDAPDNPIFNPRGTAAQGGKITVTSSQGSRYVIFSPPGKVRISATPPT